MLSKLLPYIKKIFISNKKKYPNILLLENEYDYWVYADFLVEHFKYVTQGFKISYPDGQIKNFNTIVEDNKSEAMELLWKKFLASNSDVYILVSNRTPIGFAVMEPTKILSYLFIDEKYQQQGIGSLMLNFLKEQYNSYKIRIEDYKYKSKLPQFYEKNNFIFVGKIKNYNEIYYEYKI